jgi:succinoglycan biosynthesis transport protein ExoP
VSAYERRPNQAPSNLEPTGGSPTLLTHLGVLARRKWVVLLALVITPLVALVITLSETPLYQGSAQVLLNHQNLASSVSGIPDSNAAVDPVRVAQTQADLARVPEVARRTLAAAEVHDRTALDFLNASSVSTTTNADLLTFDVTDRDPALATRLATEYAREFVAFRNELDSTAFDRARTGIERRLDQLRAAGATGSPLYVDLTAKRQQLIAIESLQTTNALLVRPADSASKVQPRPVRAVFLGVVFGLVIGLGLAFLMDALDTRVRTGDEIEERLGLPLLARVPSPPRKEKRDAIAMLSDPAGAYAESIRTLRVRLGLAGPKPGTRVIMATSATEGEGKSTTVANLAVALAQAGRRVVLCDLDARSPVIDDFFGLEARAGLMDVALGQIELEHALNVVTIPAPPYWSRQQAVNGNKAAGVRGELKVLTFGRTPPDPAEFVGSDTVAEILGDLACSGADVVLVDAPSLLDVGDAVTVSSNVDALLVVTRLQVIRRSMLSEMRRVLASCPAPTLGFVLTGASNDGTYRPGKRHVHEGPAESELESVEQ